MENLKSDKHVQVKGLEQKLKVILDSIPALVAYINKDLQYEYMNQAYERWFDIDRSSAIGRTMTEVLGEKAFQRLTMYIDKVLEGAPVNFTTDVNYLNGHRIIDATYIPDFDNLGNVKGITVLVHDVTQKIQIEKELQTAKRKEAILKSEERYLKMIDAITDYAIIFLSKEGIIENWNKGAEKIKGYTKEEIIGKHFSIFYVPEDRERNIPQAILAEAIEKGKVVKEGWRLRKDGSVFWGNVTITALHDEQQSLTGFSKVTRDLTERKLSEDKMAHYANQLEYQNKELEQFAYVASHDLQEPLRKIKTFSERILQLEKLSDQGKEYFNRSISAANRMQRLINDLLAYSRATHDPYNFERVDMNKVLREIVTSRKEFIDDNHVEIQIGDSLPIINAIPVQIGQLFDNIISNAIKYHKPGRQPIIKVSCKAVRGNSFAEKDADASGHYWHIRIADNGIGFEPQYNDRIFEIFQRLHGQGTLPGSGIGLAICKKIVMNHQGFIYARGVPDEGATFDIYLPVDN